jgi:hypothetical protein
MESAASKLQNADWGLLIEDFSGLPASDFGLL